MFIGGCMLSPYFRSVPLPSSEKITQVKDLKDNKDVPVLTENKKRQLVIEKKRRRDQAIEREKLRLQVIANEKKYMNQSGGKTDEIINKNIIIGMTKEQVLALWGRPNGIIHIPIGSKDVHERWKYGSSTYLYFEEGILTSIRVGVGL